MADPSEFWFWLLALGVAVVGGGRTWVFDSAFFVILNLAVGGSFLGPTGQPDANTAFPQPMTVDYVRAYTRDSGP